MVCDDPIHQEIERRHRVRTQARTRHPAVDRPDGSEDGPALFSLDGEELFDIDADDRIVAEDVGPAAHPLHPRGGCKHIRVQFGRRRTHNEQLIVTPCGLIIARTTFFGSEAVSSVRVCACSSSHVLNLTVCCVIGFYQSGVQDGTTSQPYLF